MLGFYNYVKRLIYTFFVVFAVALLASPAFAADDGIMVEVYETAAGSYCSEFGYREVGTDDISTTLPATCNGKKVKTYREYLSGYGTISANGYIARHVEHAAKEGNSILYYVVNEWDLGSSITCSMGKYLPANSSTCSNCPVGHWCPGGTWYIQSYSQGANPCPAGTYRYGTAQSSEAAACRTCTNTLPANATYNSASTTATCPWTCNSGYTKNSAGTACTGNTYTISFSQNGGSGGQQTSKTATYGSAMPTPITRPTRTGYTFAGYYDTSAASGGTQYYTSTGASARTWNKTYAATLYARWTPGVYTITLDAKRYASSTATSGTSATTNVSPTTIYEKYSTGWYRTNLAVPANSISSVTIPALTGYTFGGFWTGKTGTGTQVIDSSGNIISGKTTTFTSNSTLYAKWTPNKYTITVKPNGATSHTSDIIFYEEYGSKFTNTSGGTITTLPGMTRTGYAFKGFYTAASGGTQVMSGYTLPSNTTFTSDTTLYAQWAPIYTITLNYNYGSNSTTTIKEVYGLRWTNSSGTAITAYAATRAGYTFNGWYTAASGGTQKIPASGVLPSNTTFTANTTLYAQWTLKTFDTNGFGVYFKCADGSTPIPSSGSRTSFDGGFTCNDIKTPMICNGRYVEFWEDDLYSYALIDSDLCSFIDDTYNGCPDCPVTFTAYELGNYVTSTVTFNQNGGSGGQTTSKTATYGSAMPTPITTPTRTGYTFAGYYDTSAATGGTQYYTSTGASARTWNKTSATTLYARWTQCSAGTYSDASTNTCKPCAVGSYSSAGAGSCTACQNGRITSGTGKATCDKTCTNPNADKATAWNTATWNTNNTVSNSCSIKTCQSGYHLNTGSCSANTLTLNYYNGSTKLGTQTCTYGQTCTVGAGIPTPEKDGYTFNKWFDEESFYSTGDTIDLSEYIANGNATYDMYATQWTPNNYEIGLSGNGATSTGYTTKLYTKFGEGVYIDSARTKKMLTKGNNSANPVPTLPARVLPVTYNANSGSVSPTSANATSTFKGYYNGTTASAVQMVQNEGYITTSGIALKDSVLNNNSTLYAQWDAGSVTLPMPTRSGYTFQGWNTLANGTGTSYSAGASYTPSATTTLYAQWSQVTCTATNGTCGTVTVNSSNIPSVTITCYTGYSQGGGTNTTTSFTVTGSAGATSLSGTCSARTYTVTYACGSGASGTAPSNATATYNSNFTPSSVGSCAKTGYNFAGWTTTNNAGSTVTHAAGTAFKWQYTANKTFTAKWTIKSVTCPAGTYLKAGGTTTSDCIKCPISTTNSGSTVGAYCPGGTFNYNASSNQGLKACPVLNDSTRIQSSSYPNNDDGGAATMISSNIAAWYEGQNDISDCLVTYTFSNSAGAFTLEAAHYSSSTGRYDNGGSKYYYSLNPGYYLTTKFSDTYCDTSASNYASRKKLYKIAKKCSAGSYCPGYASAMPLCSSTNETYGTNMGINTCPTTGANGRTVTSPAGSSAATSCYVTCPTMMVSSGTVTMVNSTINYSGSTYAACTYNTSCKAGYYGADNTSSPSCSACTGATYSGADASNCTSCPNGGSYFDANGNGAHDTVKECYKNVAWDVANGTGTQNCYYTSGSGSSAVYAGNDIAGCYNKKVTSCDTGYAINANKDACSAITRTVTFNANGGTGSMSTQTFTYGVAQNLTANAFTRTGYTFAGWNTVANGSGTAYANKASISNLLNNITLYAQWSQCPAGKYEQDGVCVTCPKGSYCVNGIKSTCGSGTYADKEGMSECTACPAGSNLYKGALYMVSGHYGATSIDSCGAISYYVPEYMVEILGFTVDEAKEQYGYDPNADANKRGVMHATCYYDASTQQYTKDCTGVVLMCSGGYYTNVQINPEIGAPTFETNTLSEMLDTYCMPVGTGYWSSGLPHTDFDNITEEEVAATLVRHACPNGGTTSTTTSDSSDDCYKANMSCTVEHGSGKTTCHYAGTDYTNCDPCAVDTCDSGYAVSDDGKTCELLAHKITLNANGGSGVSPSALYQAYGTGWFTDMDATDAITELDFVPSKSKALFNGFFTNSNGTGTQVINKYGKIVAPHITFTAATTIYADYTACKCTAGDNVSSCTVPYADSTGCVYEYTCSNGDVMHDSGPANYTAVCKPYGNGYTCPADSTKYISCHEGKYMATKDASGNYVYNGTPTVNNSCEPCPDDAAYCPGGTSAPLYYVTFSDDIEGSPVGNGLYANVNGEYYRYHEEEYARLERLPQENYPDTHTGFTFNGYWTQSQGGEQYIDASGNFIKGPSADVTLYAQWEAKTISCNAGTYLPANSEKCEVCPAGSYCEYGSYKYSDTTQGINECPTDASNRSVNSEQGAGKVSECFVTCPDSIDIEHGTTSVKVKNPTYYDSEYPACRYLATCETGYSASGADTDPTCSQNAYFVVFMSNGGTGTMPQQERKYNDNASLILNTFTRAGYSFTGWNTHVDGSGTAYADGASGNLSEGRIESDANNAYVYLYAQWEPDDSEVTLDPNGGVAGTTSVTATYGAAMPKVSVLPTRQGYEFTGFFDSVAGGTKYYNANGTSARVWNKIGSQTLYAQWKAKTFTVKYFNGDTLITTQSCTYDSSCIVGRNVSTPVSKGHTFAGWTDSDKQKYANGADIKNIVASGEFELYAEFEPNTYIVEFNGNGADTGTMAKQDRFYGDGESLNENQFARTGYTFVGWNTSSYGSGTSYADKATGDLTSANNVTIVLYAQWMAAPSEITLDPNGGVAGTTSVIATYGAAMPKIDVLPTRAGYTFAGFVDANNTKYYNANGTSARTWNKIGSYTLTAQWTECDQNYYCPGDNVAYRCPTDASGRAVVSEMGSDSAEDCYATCSVKNIANGTTSVVNAQVQYDGTTYPACEYTTECDTGYHSAGSETAPSCAANTYTVEFDGNGATGGTMAPQSRYFNDGIRLTDNAFAKLGYEFQGWTTESNGGGKSVANRSTENLTDEHDVTITLYAKWTAATLSCNSGFYLDGAECKECVSGSYCEGGEWLFQEGTVQGMETCPELYPDSAAKSEKISDCKITCEAGYYVGKQYAACEPVGAGFWIGVNTVGYGELSKRNQCLGNTTTIGYGAGADEADDCGRKLHINNEVLYLRKSKKTAIALNVKVDGVTYYGNMRDCGDITISDNAKQTLRIKHQDKVYSVYDDSHGDNEQCQAIKYTVSYELNGGTDKSGLVTEYDVKQTTSLKSPVRDNSSFAGWYDNPEFTGSAINKIVPGTVGDLKLYAKWSCKSGYVANADSTACVGNRIIVNFNEDGGTAMANSSCEYGKTFVLPEITSTKAGAVVNGYKLANGTVASAGDSVACTYTNLGKYVGESTAVIIRWSTCAAGSYCPGDNTSVVCPTDSANRTVTSPAGSDSAEDCYAKCVNKTITGGKATLVAATQGYDGKAYPTCMYNVTCNTGYTVDETPSATPQCIANEYTVEYRGNGSDSGQMSVQQRTYNDGKTLTPNSYDKVGYSFSSWNTEADGTGTSYADKKSGNLTSTDGDKIVLNAQWSADEYVVTYACGFDGGKAPVKMTAVHDAEFVPAQNTCVNPGYMFAGWQTTDDKGASVTYPANVGFVWNYTSNKTFTAIWTPETISIDYAENGGGDVANNTCVYGETLTLPSAPTKFGYNFNGWKFTNGVKTAANATTVPCEYANVGVYTGTALATAQWVAKPIECAAGTYLPANSETCETCTAGYACAGGKYSYNANKIQGRELCTGSTYATSGATTCSACPDGYSISIEDADAHDEISDCKITCAAGQELMDGASECVTCQTSGKNSGYCPGGEYGYNADELQGWIACPTSEDTWITQDSDKWLDGYEIEKANIAYAGSVRSSITNCQLTYAFIGEPGRIIREGLRYNPDTNKYDTFSWGGLNKSVRMLNPGYYAYNRVTDCNTLSEDEKSKKYMQYTEAAECPEGYYCPGYAIGSILPRCNNTEYVELYNDSIVNGEYAFGAMKCPEDRPNSPVGSTSEADCY